MGLLDWAAHQALKRMDPERAHGIAKGAMRRGWLKGFQVVCCPKNLFGCDLPNLLGLAAGFDKNGELVGSFGQYGFGFMEVGSVTLLGGPGNPKPRLFRVGERAVMNRMGLNGLPAVMVAHKLNTDQSGFRYGVNIAKTHSPDIMGDRAIADISDCYNLMQGYGMYTVLNISCPNTKEGRTFEDPAALKELLAAVRSRYAPTKTPLLVKLSPVCKDLHETYLTCKRWDVAGFVVSNTVPHEHPKYGKGGLSGDAVRELALPMVKRLREMDQAAVIIGCGGIYTGQHMKQYLDAGADAVQAYNGFVRGPNAGPGFARKVLAESYAGKGK